MSDIKLGVTLPQFTADRDELLGGAQRAQDAGLDSVFVFDHLWPLSGSKERPIFESWSTLGYLAASTSDILIGSLVTRSSLRHPAVLAKMVATVGAVAPERLIVGIGSGDTLSRGENEAYGIPYYAGSERVAQLISTADVVRRALHDDSVSIANDFVSIEGLPTSPRPVPPKVWLGGRGDALLNAAGRIADGWNGWGGTPEEFASDAAIVRAAAPDRDVELTWGGLVVLGATDEEARQKLGSRDPKGYIVGGPEAVARRLGGFIEAGATHLVITFTDPATPENYVTLAGDIRAALGRG